MYGKRARVEQETASKIAETCGGIPLVLHSLASWHDNPAELVEMLATASWKQKFELFSRIPNAEEDQKIDVRLDTCFNRLDQSLQDTLVSLSLFRGHFTAAKAVDVFDQAELDGHILKLKCRNLFWKRTPLT